MRIKTCTLVAAAVIGTLGFAGEANAQSMRGTAYGNYGTPGPQIFPATPPLYSAGYSAPTPGMNFANRGYSPYTAGNYFPNPYTAGVPRSTNGWAVPSMQFGTMNTFRNTTVYGLGTARGVGFGAPRIHR